jgi:hypothetical protein
MRILRVLLACAAVLTAWERADAQTRLPQTTCLAVTAATAGGGALPRVRIGVDPNPKTSSDYERDDWGESIALMKTTTSNHLHYAKVWNEIERTAGTYDLEEVRFIIERSAPLDVAFNLRIIDAGSRNMPAAYRGLAWDSPTMIERVLAVIDALAPVLGTRPWSYAIGNEIDLYFQSRPAEVPAYGRLLERVKSHLRVRHPAACMTTSMQASAASQLRALYAPIFALVDHVTFTYYPLGVNFQVRPPSAAAADLQALINVARPRPVFLQEIGYPTSALLGSSPELQAEFVRRAFEFVRTAGASQILGATVLFQADMPGWLVDMIANAYGLPNSEPFKAFIATLGLRDERDRPKPGWTELERQADLIAPQRRSN